MDLQLPYHLHNRRNFKTGLGFSELVSIKYHNLFGFALTKEELERWKVGENQRTLLNDLDKDEVYFKNGFYFLRENKGAVFKRISRKKYSSQKMKIAKKAAEILGKIPTIKMVGITGSLAMKNASEDSDIDLIIITSGETLWTTRFLGYFLLRILGFNLRKPKDRNEKDKLCLNMWMDERDLSITKRNIYTAHEICQIIPLKNKNRIYEKFIFENSWVEEYWPNAVKIQKAKKILGRKPFLRFLEPVARSLQFAYMSGKLTSETVNSTRAFFHPFDWGERIVSELGGSS